MTPKEFDKAEELKRDIEPVVAKLNEICGHHDMPFVIGVCFKSFETGRSDGGVSMSHAIAVFLRKDAHGFCPEALEQAYKGMAEDDKVARVDVRSIIDTPDELVKLGDVALAINRAVDDVGPMPDDVYEKFIASTDGMSERDRLQHMAIGAANSARACIAAEVSKLKRHETVPESTGKG